ncbi:MAG: hypothetical protein JNM10_07595 [Planctomycetia bacterium]|nr:hypothetical protein [Planctomycetia bacterium]
MAAPSVRRRAALPRALARGVVACLALVAWIGVQAAALAHVGCGTCAAGAPHGHDTCRAGAPGASPRCCHGHRHAPDEGHDDGHGDAHGDAPSHPRGGDDAPSAPDDHDAGTCTLCAFAAGAVDAPAVVVALTPAAAGTPRAPTPFVAPSSAPRFEPGLARGPPTLPRS